MSDPERFVEGPGGPLNQTVLEGSEGDCRQTCRVATAIAVSPGVYSGSRRRNIEAGSRFTRPVRLHHRTSSLDLAQRGTGVLDSVRWFLSWLGDDSAIFHHSAKGTTDTLG